VLNSPWSTATVTFIVDGERVLTRSIRFLWSWQREGLAARRDLPAGAPVTPEDFSPSTIDALKTGGALVTAESFQEPVMLARAVKAGQVLTANQLQLRKIVLRGGQVNVHYLAGTMKVSMIGVALDDGVKGATIQVMNSTSRKRVLAKVVDERNLEFVQPL
jgi:flagellar basal body P-ring formation protein FlgA